jgi:hypothetical protein
VLAAVAPDDALLEAWPVALDPPTPVADSAAPPWPVVALDEPLGAAPPSPLMVSSPQAPAIVLVAAQRSTAARHRRADAVTG